MVVTCFSSYYEKFADGTTVCIDDEIPFDVPKGWELARFGNVMYNRDSERIPLSVSERSKLSKTYDYYGASGVIDKVDKYLFDKDLLLIGEDGANLINRSTPIAFIARGKYWVNNHAHVLDCIDSVFMQYVCLYINSISLVDYVTGTAQPKMNQEKMNSILLFIPPYNEQKRILEKLQEVLPVVEQYDSAQSKLDGLNANINELLKKSILQEAIQGKLVPQDPNDEPASVLLQRIKEEKLRLIKEGKLKKKDVIDSTIFRGDDNKYFEKKGKEVICIDEEIPFNIPQSWEWCRLGTITSIFGGKRIPVGCKLSTIDTGHKYIRVSDMKNGTIALSDIHYITEEVYQQIKAYSISKDDLYITVAGTIGRIGEVPKELDNANLTENADKIVFSQINKRFLMFALQSEYVQSQIKSHTTKVGQPKLAIMRIQELLIALPPLQEQIRIVKRFEDVSVHLT